MAVNERDKFNVWKNQRSLNLVPRASCLFDIIYRPPDVKVRRPGNEAEISLRSSKLERYIYYHVQILLRILRILIGFDVTP